MRTDADDLARVRDPAIELLLSHTATLTDEWCLIDFLDLVNHLPDSEPAGRRDRPEKRVIAGTPDPSKISTSYVERQNLTMRMGMRRFTRLTNGFSKKVENLAHAVSLHCMHFNFARPHQSLRDAKGRRITPAMAAGVADHVWSLTDIAGLLD